MPMSCFCCLFCRIWSNPHLRGWPVRWMWWGRLCIADYCGNSVLLLHCNFIFCLLACQWTEGRTQHQWWRWQGCLLSVSIWFNTVESNHRIPGESSGIHFGFWMLFRTSLAAIFMMFHAFANRPKHGRPTKVWKFEWFFFLFTETRANCFPNVTKMFVSTFGWTQIFHKGSSLNQKLYGFVMTGRHAWPNLINLYIFWTPIKVRFVQALFVCS